MVFNFKPFQLIFKRPAGTSRGTLIEKETFLIQLHSHSNIFFGETGLFRGLSFDDHPDYEEKLKSICENFDFNNPDWWDELREFPSIQFGLEQVLKANENYNQQKLEDSLTPVLFPSKFTEGKTGIPINGLIWMGSPDFMKQQIREKINQNFRCIKLKIGVKWDEEHAILKELRKEFSISDMEIRVDANGAFSVQEAQTVLKQLAELGIHSIEQPIKAGQIHEMAQLCAETPTPIALDEELIGVIQREEKSKLLQTIQPQYIILKPSLVGGWKGSEEWIEIAETQNSGWWITSALESNIGLNAIAQWTYTLGNPLPQGLGTGGLFENNFPSRLKVIEDRLFFV